MKFKLTNLNEFSDIGTVVYYKKRPFYPELGDIQDEDFLLKSGMSEGFLYSTSLTSEYVDFAKTGFTLSPEIKEEIIPNLYDYEDTLDIYGTPYFDDLVINAFPGLSKSGRPIKSHFFGKLTSSTETSYLIHLPRETWKVEIYNSRIPYNYGDSNRQGFFDCDILEKIGKKPIESPVLTIYLGPLYDTGIKNYTYNELILGGFPLYLYRYTLSGELILDRYEYDSFTENILSKTEYIESYREEVESEKLLYIINSPTGRVESINFYPLAYPSSKNPHPHMSEEILRNDELWSEKGLEVSSEVSPGIVVDNRSGVLLGLKDLSETDSSWFKGSLGEGKNIFSKSSSPKSIKVNGKEWIRAIDSKVFGDNPEISPWWYSPEDLPKSLFDYYYVTVVKGKGDVSPCGQVYIGPGKQLEMRITPKIGYEYQGFSNVFKEEISEIGDKVIINTSRYQDGYKFEVLFEEILYSLNLQINCSKDYPGNGGFSNTYNLSDSSSSSGTTYTPLSNTGARLLYLSDTGKIMEYGGPGDNHNRLNPLKISDTKELKIKLDFSDTFYEFSGDLKYGDGRSVEKLDDWYVLKISSEPPILEGNYIMPVGEIISRKYTVTIKTSSGIQVSTPKKNILEFHNMDPKSVKPIPRPFISKILFTEESEGIIEVWKDGNLILDEDESWSLTEGTDGIWTFQIPLIENDYEIIIK